VNWANFLLAPCSVFRFCDVLAKNLSGDDDRRAALRAYLLGLLHIAARRCEPWLGGDLTALLDRRSAFDGTWDAIALMHIDIIRPDDAVQWFATHARHVLPESLITCLEPPEPAGRIHYASAGLDGQGGQVSKARRTNEVSLEAMREFMKRVSDEKRSEQQRLAKQEFGKRYRQHIFELICAEQPRR
jgi:hypothetical protein